MPARIHPNESSVVVGVRVPESQANRIKKLAEQTGLNRSRIGSQAIAEYLARLDEKEPQAS